MGVELAGFQKQRNIYVLLLGKITADSGKITADSIFIAVLLISVIENNRFSIIKNPLIPY